MARPNEVFNAFVRANDLEQSIAKGEVMYRGTIFPEPQTREQIEGTAQLAGFSDGYQGHPNRYEKSPHSSPRGTFRPQFGGSALGQSADAVLEALSCHQDPKMRGYFSEAMEGIARTRNPDYHSQYELGQAQPRLGSIPTKLDEGTKRDHHKPRPGQSKGNVINLFGGD